MALSKPALRTEFAGQHYLVCGSEDCERNCQFYCNACHRRLCEQCKDEHLKNPNNKTHEVVLFQKRKRQLPEQKCQNHPQKNIDMLCQQCQVAVCSKCATGDHHGHTFIDLEQIYSDKCAVCLDKIATLQDYVIPTSQDLQKEARADDAEIRNITENIRTSMKAEAEFLKSLVDTVTSENIKQVNEMESSILEMLQFQDSKYENYKSYLFDIVKKLHHYLSPTNSQMLMDENLENLTIDAIPETTKPIPPVFTAGQHSKEDIIKLLGKVSLAHNNQESRKIKPIKTAPSRHSKSTQKQMKTDREKPTLSLSPSVTKVREYTVPNVSNAWHISVDKLGRLWVSDYNSGLVQIDLQGNLLQKIKTSGGSEGYHTVTLDGGLLFTNRDKKVIYRLTSDKKITKLFKTGDWRPQSIHSSRINGDILVGMRKDAEAKITRYNMAGKKLQSIQRDNKGLELYYLPLYITENINGDICASDIDKRAVVVVNKSGQHRFSYKGQGSGFSPCAICTDVLGHILVCDQDSESVYLLSQDGEFLSIILSQQHGLQYPYGVCVDDENNLYEGQCNSNKVTVYKYLQ